MYSLASTTQELSICWRCEYRLAKRAAILKPHQTRLSRSPTCRPLSSGRRHQQEQNVVYNGQFDGNYSDLSPLVDRRSLQDQIIFRPKIDGQTLARRRFHLEEQTVTLDMNALGHPAQIRIIPDRPKLRKQLLVTEQSGSEKRSNTTPENILRSIAAEAAVIDPATVNEHIESIRNAFIGGIKPIESPTLAQCQKAAHELDMGFTVAQLEAYVRQEKLKRDQLDKLDYDNLEGRYYTKLCSRSAWFTGLSNFPQEALNRLDPGTSVSKKDDFIIGLLPSQEKSEQSRKQYAVERVLRQAWKIRCREEKALEGELDIGLQANHLSLLLNHKKDIFKQLSDQYAAKIDISQSRHIIRITGDYAICSDLSKLVYFMIEKIASADLELPSALKGPLRSTDPYSVAARSMLNSRLYINHVEKLTNTIIKTEQSTQGNYVSKIRVYYLGPDTADLEDVQRLINQLLDTGDRTKTQVRYYPFDKSMIPIQSPIEAGSGVAWTERRVHWGRWRDTNVAKSIKVVEGASTSQQDDYTKYNQSLNRQLAQSVGTFLSGKKPQHEEGIMAQIDQSWQPVPKYVVSAVLGHISYPIIPELHRYQRFRQTLSRTYKSEADHEYRLRKALHDTLESRRTLITNLPEALSAIKYQSSLSQDVRHEIHVRLKPHRAVDNESLDVKSLPDLDMRVILNNRDRTSNLETIQFICDSCETDLLLPQEVSDVRFRAYTHHDALETVDHQLSQFFKQSNFDVWGEDRLKTPANVAFLVPQFVLPDEVREKVADAKGIRIEYTFASLEYQSYMSMLHEGYRLIFMTVEAGKTGGRRTELRFETTLEQRHSKAHVKNEFVPFFHTVREFIHGMGTSRQDQLEEEPEEEEEEEVEESEEHDRKYKPRRKGGKM